MEKLLIHQTNIGIERLLITEKINRSPGINKVAYKQCNWENLFKFSTEEISIYENHVEKNLI